MFLFLLCFAALQLNWFPQIVSSRSENRKQEVPVAMARCECYVLTNTAQWHLAGNAVAVWTAFECADARACMRASESVHVFLPPWSSRRRMAVFAKWTQIRFQLVLLWHFQQPCRPLHHQIPSLLLIKHSCALKTVSKIRQMSTSLAWPSISFMPNQQCGHMPLLNSQLRTAFRYYSCWLEWLWRLQLGVSGLEWWMKCGPWLPLRGSLLLIAGSHPWQRLVQFTFALCHKGKWMMRWRTEQSVCYVTTPLWYLHPHTQLESGWNVQDHMYQTVKKCFWLHWVCMCVSATPVYMWEDLRPGVITVCVFLSDE